MNSKLLKLAFHLFPPFWGAGIKVKTIANDYKSLRVEMPLRWYNRNIKGTHFGGNLFSMTDPFLMIMLIQVLGKSYDVWDQSSDIRFCKPGTGKVIAHFELSPTLIKDILNKTRDGSKFTPEFIVHITNEAGDTIAVVTKTIYIRKRFARENIQGSDHDLAA